MFLCVCVKERWIVLQKKRKISIDSGFSLSLREQKRETSVLAQRRASAPRWLASLRWPVNWRTERKVRLARRFSLNEQRSIDCRNSALKRNLKTRANRSFMRKKKTKNRATAKYKKYIKANRRYLDCPVQTQ